MKFTHSLVFLHMQHPETWPPLTLAHAAAINQFNKTLEKNAAETLFKLLLKYRPETKEQKRTRLLSEAEAREAGKVQLECLRINACSNGPRQRQGQQWPSAYALPVCTQVH